VGFQAYEPVTIRGIENPRIVTMDSVTCLLDKAFENIMMEITVLAPGRIVLFGEHQDYLGCPVIPAAIDRSMTITGTSLASRYDIFLKDMGVHENFPARDLEYVKPRDYLRSGVKVLQYEGLIPKDSGAKAEIHGTIPIQAGLSSSSALCVAWILFLTSLHEHSLTPMEITKLAHRAEVLEFNEPGGMQDHMVSAFGYVNYEEFDPIRCTRIMKEFPGIVVANSLERKPTLDTLERMKSGVKRALNRLGVEKVALLTREDLELPEIDKLDQEARNYLQAAVKNHEITKLAYITLKKTNHDPFAIGQLMNKHHSYLRDNLTISTPLIEKMIERARQAGALGCKITGSGNGGCMIAYCPGNEDKVVKELKKLQVDVFIGNISPGARVVHCLHFSR
jgi:galactokinase